MEVLSFSIQPWTDIKLMTVTAIRIMQTNPPTEITSDRVYFAFASGRITYDCVSCGAHCCRGYGFALNRSKELPGVLRRDPRLQLFFTGYADEDKSHAMVRNCPPGCFFLTGGGLCRIQAECGHAAKPETCRHFPFNNIRQAGPYLIVSANDSLCPLAITPHGNSDAKSSHQHLLEQMSVSGLSETVPQCEIPWNRGIGDVIALERAIVTSSESHLQDRGYVNFAARQLALTAERVPDGCDGQEAVEGWALRDSQGLVNRSLKLLGVRPTSIQLDDAELTRTMIAVTPLLRCQLLFPRVQADRGKGRKSVDVGRVPYVVLGTYLIAAIARSIGMSSITFQTLSQLCKRFQSLLWLLSNADRVMVLKPGARIQVATSPRSDWQIRHIRVVKALLPRRQGKCKLTLEDIISEHGMCHRLENIEFLRQLANHLQGSVIPVEEERRYRIGWRLSVKRGVQRAVFGATGDKELAWYLAATQP